MAAGGRVVLIGAGETGAVTGVMLGYFNTAGSYQGLMSLIKSLSCSLRTLIKNPAYTLIYAYLTQFTGL
jgi:hypothetical protein